MCEGCIREGEISREVADRIDAFLEVWPRSSFGPFHIAYDDYNVSDEDLAWCLKRADEALGDAKPDDCSDEMWKHYKSFSREEIEAGIAFAKELLAIPEAERVPNSVLQTV